MNTLLLKLAITTAVTGTLTSSAMHAQISPTIPKAARVQITQGPEIEMSKEFLTIIRWTTNNPGGSPEHYGVVHYGTDPKNLSETAKSPIRLNPDHALAVFRVRLDNLKPGTTYYYKVGSIESDGPDDGTKSAVKQFTTPGKSQRRAGSVMIFSGHIVPRREVPLPRLLSLPLRPKRECRLEDVALTQVSL